jgi:hypothetical protein
VPPGIHGHSRLPCLVMPVCLLTSTPLITS